MPTISLDLVREHIRQDETVDDELLKAYVSTTIRLAEAYIGTPLSRRHFTGEENLSPNLQFSLKDTPVDNLKVYDFDGGTDITEYVRKIGRRRYSVNECLCGTIYTETTHGSIRPTVYVEYDVGPHDDEFLDEAIELGVLKHVAYLYENRGDEANTSGQVGVNSSIHSSGAAELWNLFKSVGF